MKKLAIVFAVIMAIIVSAKAEMLLWQVTEENYDQWGLSSSAEGAYSSLCYWDGSQRVLVAQASGLNQGKWDSDWSSPGLNSNYDYFIEVGTYDSNSDLIKGGYYGAFRYSDLALSATGLTAETMRAVARTAMSHYGPVPEPTSGMMLLVGMALLGLKRRRV